MPWPRWFCPVATASRAHAVAVGVEIADLVHSPCSSRRGKSGIQHKRSAESDHVAVATARRRAQRPGRRRAPPSCRPASGKPPVTINGMRATLRIAAAYSRKYASRARVLVRTGTASSGATLEADQARLFVRAAGHLQQVDAFVVEPRHDLQAVLVREAALAEVVRVQLERDRKVVTDGLPDRAQRSRAGSGHGWRAARPRRPCAGSSPATGTN